MQRESSLAAWLALKRLRQRGLLVWQEGIPKLGKEVLAARERFATTQCASQHAEGFERFGRKPQRTSRLDERVARRPGDILHQWRMRLWRQWRWSGCADLPLVVAF
jgi:hypothetical protein